MRSYILGVGRSQAHDVISDAVFAVYLIRVFGVFQEHDVVICQLHRPDRLLQVEVTEVLNIIRPKVQTRGSVQLESQCRRSRVEPVVAMVECLH